MQRHRFYAPPSRLFDSRILLDPEESHHLSRVLRLQPGATVFAFDGNGAEYECQVARVSKDVAELTIQARLSNEVESPLQLTLGQALIKGDKFDWVVQKATELGVTRLVPLATEHSEFRKAEGRELRLPRWRKVALEAMKQCGRRKLIEITEAQSFQQFCAGQTDDLRLILSETGGTRLLKSPPCKAITLAIGSEGGWSANELKLAETQGFLSIYLGNRTLRTETAAVTGVSLVQYLYGDLG